MNFEMKNTLHDLLMKEIITGELRYDKLSKQDLFDLLDSVIGELKIDLNYIISDDDK